MGWLLLSGAIFSGLAALILSGHARPPSLCGFFSAVFYLAMAVLLFASLMKLSHASPSAPLDRRAEDVRVLAVVNPPTPTSPPSFSA